MFSINYRDARPVYEQVKDSMRRTIITGVMKTDEKLPSVREAAAELAINPNTIQKAYRELESEGYIYSVPGKGNFVGECREAKESRKAEFFGQLDVNVNELLQLGVAAEEVCSHIMSKHGREEKND